MHLQYFLWVIEFSFYWKRLYIYIVQQPGKRSSESLFLSLTCESLCVVSLQISSPTANINLYGIRNFNISFVLKDRYSWSIKQLSCCLKRNTKTMYLNRKCIPMVQNSYIAWKIFFSSPYPIFPIPATHITSTYYCWSLL